MACLKKIILIGLILIFLLIGGCSKSIPLQEKSNSSEVNQEDHNDQLNMNNSEPQDRNNISLDKDNKQNFTVKYHESSGFAGWEVNLIIKDNGSLVYHYQNDGRVTENEKDYVNKSNLTRSELKDFKDLVKKANITKFNDSYRCESENCMTDTPTTSIKFQTSTQTKKVRIHQPENLPIELKEILGKIQRYKSRFN